MPMWSRSGGGELFFAAANQLAAVPVSAGTTFTYGKQQPLFVHTLRVPISGQMVAGRSIYLPMASAFLWLGP